MPSCLVSERFWDSAIPFRGLDRKSSTRSCSEIVARDAVVTAAVQAIEEEIILLLPGFNYFTFVPVLVLVKGYKVVVASANANAFVVAAVIMLGAGRGGFSSCRRGHDG
jgi:hypothetical protein